MQRLPSFRGKRKLCKFFIDVTRISKKKSIRIQTKSGTFELPNVKEIISFDLFTSGVYENGLVEFLSKAIPKNGVFIDIGANIGAISIPLALERKDIRIIAIEASPWIFNVLQGNVLLNRLSNITALNYAVYSESGKQVGIYAPKELFGKGSLSPIYTKEEEQVETITIDDIVLKQKLDSLDFLKVDVEGFEASVFLGMKDAAKIKKPRIVFEFLKWAETSAGFQAGEAQSVLLSYGYKLQRFNNRFKLTGPIGDSVIMEEEINLLAS